MNDVELGALSDRLYQVGALDFNLAKLLDKDDFLIADRIVRKYIVLRKLFSRGIRIEHTKECRIHLDNCSDCNCDVRKITHALFGPLEEATLYI